VDDSNPQTRILVLSASFGGGHTAVSRAIKEYLRGHHAVSVDIVDLLERFSPNLNVLAKFAYQQPDEFFPAFAGTFDELKGELPENPAVAEARTSLLPALTEYLGTEQPDAVIATYPFAAGLATEAAEGACPCSALVPTYDGRRLWLHPGVEIFFVPSRTVREQLTVAGVAWDRIVESGIPVREQFAERTERSDARAALGLADKFTVLLRVDHGTPLEAWEAAHALADLGVQVAALAGDNKRILERLEKESEAVATVRPFGRVDAVAELMAACDVFVSRPAGLMLPEACAAGLPMVLRAPIPGQEVSNVDFLVNYGAALLARDTQDVVERVRFLSTHHRRMEQMAESARIAGKPAATQTVCERVLAAVR
jgi:processive 1,2-diacylglycerol beta-glucosyltransferase